MLYAAQTGAGKEGWVNKNIAAILYCDVSKIIASKSYNRTAKGEKKLKNFHFKKESHSRLYWPIHSFAVSDLPN